MKCCTKCNKNKPLTEFHYKNKKKGWLKSRCKDCSKETAQAFRTANPNYFKEYYEQNKEDILKDISKRYQEDEQYREYQKEKSRQWRKDKKEWYNEYMKFYLKEYRMGLRRKD